MKKFLLKFRKHDKRRGRGALLFIMILLSSSAILRLAVGSGEAIAQVRGNSSLPAQTHDSENEMNHMSEPATRPHKAELATLIGVLHEKEVRLKKRERQLDMRSKALSVADEEISRRLVVLEQAETSLRETLSLANGAAEGDLSRLTTVYENMKPKDAAAVFEAMEPSFAAGFLGRMRPDSAAAILAGLKPEKAYTISVLLAGRNASVPKT